MKLHLASGNPHKVAELSAFAQADARRDGRDPIEIVSARDVGGMPAVAEDTGTFTGNARKKARALQSVLPRGAIVLADDSGVCVDALNGGPGVESAYFAGPQGDPVANLNKLAGVLSDVPDGRRSAHFLCVLFVLMPDGTEHVFEGLCRGRLLREPRGGAGFGYDPLFVPDGYTRSYARSKPRSVIALAPGRNWRAGPEAFPNCRPRASGASDQN
jgi:XTP/dITP diphosphohydrolase